MTHPTVPDDKGHTDGPGVKGARSSLGAVAVCRQCGNPAAEGMPYCEPCECRILDRLVSQLLGEIRTRSTPRNTFRR